MINLVLPNIFNQLLENFNQGANCDKKRFLSGLCYFIIITFLQGHPGLLNGVLSTITSMFWIPVKHNIVKLVSLKVYSHVLGLPYAWHETAKSEELLKIIVRSGYNIDRILNYVLFSVLPPLADMAISVIYFANKTNYVFAAIVGCTFITYLSLTYLVMSWKESLNRSIKECQDKNKRLVMDTLVNVVVVKLYNNQTFECNALKASLERLQVTLLTRPEQRKR